MYEGLMAKGLPSQGALKRCGFARRPVPVYNNPKCLYRKIARLYEIHTYTYPPTPACQGSKGCGSKPTVLTPPLLLPAGRTETHAYPALPMLTRPYRALPALTTLIRPYQIASPKPRSLPNEPVNRTVISFSSRGSSFLSFRSPEMVRDAHKMAPI